MNNFRGGFMKRIFALAVSLALAGTAAAQEGTLKKIKDSGSITIGHRDASVPFSYYDDKQRPIGYAMDLCMKIVDAVKSQLKMPKLEVKYQLVTSANRIPLMANGTIDLECGSTTNNLARQEQVGFTITHFVTANRFVTKRASKINKLADLKGKTVVSTAGTTNIKQITEINAAQNMGMNIISANGHPEAFQMVETGRAVAFVMDDILLYGLVAQSRRPKDYVISSEALSVEPYGIMVRKDDKEFKKIADDAMRRIYKSGEINKIYAKWFTKPIPPRNINLNLPMGAQMKKVVANPTDSGDPNVYK
jgi:glutamate/aspartate transport system substrate-binding protein